MIEARIPDATAYLSNVGMRYVVAPDTYTPKDRFHVLRQVRDLLQMTETESERFIGRAFLAHCLPLLTGSP